MTTTSQPHQIGISLFITVLAAAGLPPAFAAEPPAVSPAAKPKPGPAWGAADVQPTPERPLNFRAGGNGWYPGATPPTEWSEGTPVQVDMKGTFGNPILRGLGGDGLGSSTVIAGQYLITSEGVDTDGSGALDRGRTDRKALGGFRVIDISDPAKPRQVNTRRNLLGYADPPADYVVKNYLAEFDPFLFAGCYKGTPSYFGTDLAGVVPHGDKLLIQTSAFLYCIGEK